MSMALAPAATLRTPSAKMAYARIVALLVPSPTASSVHSAACRIIWAPRLSLGFLLLNSVPYSDINLCDSEVIGRRIE